jgi:hypothetical protein
MEIISNSEACNLLLSHGLKIGDWGQVTQIAGVHRAIMMSAPESAVRLLELAFAISECICGGGWILLQFDKSNSLDSDEVSMIEVLLNSRGSSWNWQSEGTLVLGRTDNHDSIWRKTQLGLVINFALALNWHLYVVTDDLEEGVRVAFLDGVAYLFDHAEKPSMLAKKISILSSTARP